MNLIDTTRRIAAMRAASAALLVLMALVFASPASAQPTQDDARDRLEQARVEAVRARAFIRAAETQLTKTIVEIDAALDAMDAEPVDPPVDPVDPADPADPPSPVQGFTDLDWTGSIDLPNTATASDFQAALNTDRPVRLAAGSTLSGSWVIPNDREQIGVHGDGPRPVLAIPAGANGLDITNSQSERVVIQGIAVHGPELPHRGTAVGIRLRLTGQEGRYARSVLIEDCEVRRFDDLIQIVDDWARSQPAGTPGRIGLTVNRCILREAWGSDSHSIGIYVEGLAEGSIVNNTAIDHIGWRYDHPEDKNQRSHCIYAQQFGAPLAVAGCVLTNPAANSLQLRAGGYLADSIMSGQALGPYVDGRGSVVRGNVMLDQVDINADAPRGHGYILSGQAMRITDNLAARRHGQSGAIPAYKSISSTSTLTGNVAVDWQRDSLNFEIDGVRLAEPGDNRTVDAPGIPTLDPSPWLDRPRGVWGEQYETTDFIARCWEAI